MDSQRLHDESPESHLTETWFRSLVDSFGLNATSGTLVAVVRYRLVTYNQSSARVLIRTLCHPLPSPVPQRDCFSLPV